jgi:hypothetical protein
LGYINASGYLEFWAKRGFDDIKIKKGKEGTNFGRFIMVQGIIFV